jgi:hypothetical protein
MIHLEDESVQGYKVENFKFRKFCPRIFMAPKNVLFYSGSASAALVIWAIAGVVSCMSGELQKNIRLKIECGIADLTYITRFVLCRAWPHHSKGRFRLCVHQRRIGGCCSISGHLDRILYGSVYQDSPNLY